MTPRLARLDRVAALLLGLSLVALGLLLLDWRYREVLTYDDTLRTGSVHDVLTSSWWPWVFAVAGVALALVGLRWLLAHLGRGGHPGLRLGTSDATGRVEVDLRSLADAAAVRLGDLAPLTGTGGTGLRSRRGVLVDLRGHLEPDADLATLAEAAATCTTDVATALPDDMLTCRVVVDAPRRGGARSARSDRIRVR